jgi:hypothetical protein
MGSDFRIAQATYSAFSGVYLTWRGIMSVKYI